ncbi:MAG TPA: methyltransferase domain-containing protein [Acidimicrobiales bacterium]|nr:methyltransferase domain-containing protein [Acidimicrobiales bacterium]
MAVTTITEEDTEQIAALSGRIFMAGLEALELLNVEVGLRLGLYNVLAERGASTAEELATAAGIAERYAREWLEQQAVSGVLTANHTADASSRRFALPPAHAHVLLDADSPANTTALAAFIAECGRMLPALVDAFRSGGGVPYADYAIHDLQAAFTRPVFANNLLQDWLPALPDIHGRLIAGESLRIAEIGCGEGVASITIARAFPHVVVHGYDLDEASIAAARKNAAEAGVADRARFELSDASKGAAAIAGDAKYDLVFAVEMLHDVPDPVGVLTTMRELRSDSGAVLVADERVADEFTAPGDEMERFMYAASVLHCLPVGLVEPGSAATGTVIRSSIVRDYAARAGFADTTVLTVEHPQFRLYRLETA